ncbi:hypothetical protein A1F94_011473 [Pyrenophora tritici-repentis]|nr:hypothetical protein A1F94_011473 [Pyrenophora tritici-repentis]
MDMDMDSESDTDSDVTDVLGDASEPDDLGFESQATSVPSTPEYSLEGSVLSLPDATRLEGLQLYAEERPDDEHMDDYALSPSHSRNHSLDRLHTNGSSEVQVDWAAHIALHQAKSEALHIENIEPPSSEPPSTQAITPPRPTPPMPPSPLSPSHPRSAIRSTATAKTSSSTNPSYTAFPPLTAKCNTPSLLYLASSAPKPSPYSTATISGS